MPPVCRPRPPSCGEEGPPRKKIYRSFSQPFSGARGGTEHQSVQKSAPEAKRADPAAERGARERRAASYHRAGGRVLAARAAINRKERLKTMNENDLQNAGQSCRCHLAIATVPMQRFEQIYPVSEALYATAFQTHSASPSPALKAVSAGVTSILVIVTSSAESPSD